MVDFPPLNIWQCVSDIESSPLNSLAFLFKEKRYFSIWLQHYFHNQEIWASYSVIIQFMLEFPDCLDYKCPFVLSAEDWTFLHIRQELYPKAVSPTP